MTRKLGRRAAIVLAAALGGALFADVTARNGLTPPYFSIDLQSPEVVGGFVSAADILTPPGPGFPSVVLPAATHRLLSPFDELDGLSLADPIAALGAMNAPHEPNPDAGVAVGACCTGSGCVVTTQVLCVNMGGTYIGDDTFCGGVRYFRKGCLFPYEDITATGTLAVTASSCNDCGENVLLPFPMRFFGATFSSVAINSNGLLTFGGPNGNPNNVAIPNSAAPNLMICGAWDDLDTTTQGRIFFEGRTNPNRFIVEWDNVPQRGQADSNNFQIVLFENGSIEFRYAAMTPQPAGDVTVGVENAAGTIGLALPNPGAGNACYRIAPVNYADPCVGQTFAILFSVDRFAIGAVPPDPSISAIFPFNVQEQAAKNQAAGDIFMSLLLFNRDGPIPPGLRAAPNNTLVFNHGDAGGDNLNEDPPAPFDSPEVFVPPAEEISDADAGMGTETSASLHGDGGPPDFADRAIQPYFFSVTRNSPSLSFLPGSTPSGADIFVDFQPMNIGGEQRYVGPEQIGLVPFDEIDAMIVGDDGDRFFEDGIDQILFSLTADSPSAPPHGPGAIFTTRGLGTFQIYATAQTLGLRPSDNLDILDFVLADDIDALVQQVAIGFVCNCPGDANCDSRCNLADLSILLGNFGTAFGATRDDGDFDDDGDVDISDLAILLGNFGGTCGD
jgi:hypothetical protein